MSNQHISKAQLFEIYVRSFFPDATIDINTRTSEDRLYFVVCVHITQVQWSAQFLYSDANILTAEFSDILGFEYVSGKYNEDISHPKHIYDMPEYHVTFGEFVKIVADVEELADKITDGVVEKDYLYSSHGFALRIHDSASITLDPFEGVFIYHNMIYRDVAAVVKPEIRICSHEQFVGNKDHYIGIIRETISKIKEFEYKIKEVIDNKLQELDNIVEEIVEGFNLS